MNFSALVSCPLFAGVHTQELPGLLSCLNAAEKRFAKGEIIFRAGEPLTRFGVLLTGSVMVAREDDSGARSVLGVFHAPELFAETFAFAEPDTSPVTVAANEESTAILLDCRRIASPCAKGCACHRLLSQNLLENFARKNLLLNQKIECMSQRTTREKLLTYLHIEAQRAGSRRFPAAMDRQALADYLGVERSAMCAQIGQLKREGVIRADRKFFELL